jgi:hypothetical protein
MRNVLRWACVIALLLPLGLLIGINILCNMVALGANGFSTDILRFLDRLRGWAYGQKDY